jgi:putative SOS response-associated peptidase YedK
MHTRAFGLFFISFFPFLRIARNVYIEPPSGGFLFCLNLTMCYSNSSTSTTQQLAERYSKLVPSQPIELSYYFASGFQFPNWHVVNNDEVLQQMRWGLLPNWYRGANWIDFASKTLNARIESCHEKASFKALIETNRCLVPSSGFFEWHTKAKIKTPHFIKMKNQSVFSIAGLYDTWLDPTSGAIEQTFTILTTAANVLMSQIHNSKQRMPLILMQHEEVDWLNGNLALAQVADRSDLELEAWEINKKIVLGPTANSKEVSQKFYNFSSKQRSLFD